MRRRDKLSICFFLFTYPLIVLGALLSVSTFQNDLYGWLAAGSKAKSNYDAFVKQFGDAESIIISWPGCKLDDPRLDVALSSLQLPTNSLWIADVVSGKSMVEQMVRDSALDRSEAISRLMGVVIGKDGISTCLIVRLTEHTSANRHEFFRKLIEESRDWDVPANQMRVSGIAQHLDALDQEGLWSPLRVIPFIILVSMLLTYRFTRQLDLTIAVAALSGYVGLFSLAIVYLANIPLNLVVWTLPTLTMLLTTSASLHFLGYYRFALESHGKASAVQIATSLATVPTAICALTTAVGLFSLVFSETPPVRQFGIFGGVAVLFSAVLVLLCLPAWLSLRPVSLETLNLTAIFSNQSWKRLAEVLLRVRYWVCGAFFASMVILGAFIPQLRTSVLIKDLFQAQSSVISDAVWLEEHVVELNSVEILVRFSQLNDDQELERFRLIQALGKQFRQHPRISGVLSGATFAPRLPTPREGIRGIISRRLTKAKLDQLKKSLCDNGLLNESDGSETWRFSLAVSCLTKVDCDELLKDIEQSVKLVEADRHFESEMTWLCTGPTIAFDSVERQFLADLQTTYLTAIGATVAILYLLVRSLPGALILSIPNVFPAAVVLGAVSFFEAPLDVVSLMTASVALGIAVDDTLHFYMWCKHRVDEGVHPLNAIVESLEYCGNAMLQTSLVTGLSMLLYLLSGFMPTQRFGFLLSAMLLTAVFADLFLLPSLLGLKISWRTLLRPKQNVVR